MTLLLALLLASGCSDAPVDGGGGGSDDVGAGLSDVSVDDDGGDVDEGDSEEASDTDGLSVFPSDLPVITDIDEDGDLCHLFPDADVCIAEPDAGPEPEVVETPDVVEDVAAPSDASLADAVTTDVEPGDADQADTAVDAGPDTFLADCDNLGVAPSWEGTFDGAIEYHIPAYLADEFGFNPPDGILIVGGALAFEISCVDSKLIVNGDMDGTANVSGEGSFPFEVKLAGYFNPETGLLNASLIDGMVLVYGLWEIYFSGDFTGTLVGDTFEGQQPLQGWFGQYDGNNLEDTLPAGDPPEADGLGSWTATATETD